MNQTAVLVLEDGSVFRGVSIGWPGITVGEVVFNTAMTGYQEILTDPSYAKQIVTLTYPHIGNTGTNLEDEESPSIYAAGLIVKDSSQASNWRNEKSLSDYLHDREIVAIAGIDTRRLTRLIRSKGAQRGCICADGSLDIEAATVKAQGFPGLQGMDLAKVVSAHSKSVWRQGTWRLSTGLPADRSSGQFKYKVAAYDFGIKRNILRILSDKSCEVTVYPATTRADEILQNKPDGVFLSNGPGDPEPCDYAIEAIQVILNEGIPVFGICLGHQLLALASGAKTVKMKFGHHGANHPVQDLKTGKVMISSQNHGFAVDEKSLPGCLIATHRSLFDGSLQGVHRTDKPAFGFQGHPEASPGPHDVAELFDHFIELMENHA